MALRRRGVPSVMATGIEERNGILGICNGSFVLASAVHASQLAILAGQGPCAYLRFVPTCFQGAISSRMPILCADVAARYYLAGRDVYVMSFGYLFRFPT